MSNEPRRAPSISSMRFVEGKIRPILERWQRATTEGEQIQAIDDFVTAISDEGARRRKDLEEEIERKDHLLADRDQAIELLQTQRSALLAENTRLRDAMGGTNR